MPVAVVANGRLLSEIEQRQAVALRAAGDFYLGQMAQALSNSPARSGRRYDFFKGRLYPLDAEVRFFRKGGKVRPMRRPASGWKVRGRIHVASRPGEAPALLRGDLRRRRASRLSRDAGGLVMAFGSNVPYARRLEMELGRESWFRVWRAARRPIADVYAYHFKRAGRR